MKTMLWVVGIILVALLLAGWKWTSRDGNVFTRFIEAVVYAVSALTLFIAIILTFLVEEVKYQSRASPTT